MYFYSFQVAESVMLETSSFILVSGSEYPTGTEGKGAIEPVLVQVLEDCNDALIYLAWMLQSRAM